MIKDAIANYLADRLRAQVSSAFAGGRNSHRDRLTPPLGRSVITTLKMIAGLGVSKEWAAGSLKQTSLIIHYLDWQAARRLGGGRKIKLLLIASMLTFVKEASAVFSLRRI